MSETLTIFGIDYPNTEGFKVKDDLGTTHTYGEGGGGGSSSGDYAFEVVRDQTYTTVYLPSEPFADIKDDIESALSDNHDVFIIADYPTVSAKLISYQDNNLNVIDGHVCYNWMSYSTYETVSVNNGQHYNAVETMVYIGLSEGTQYTEWTQNTYIDTPNLQAKTNISPTTSSQTISADNGYDGLSSVQINAMPSGTAGTPTATKGTVSNHSVSVTPSVTNTTGYITGSTKTGTAVTVTASELVSGTYTVDSSGTKDVTNYASASVPSGTAGTPSASKGAVSNHAVTVTPSVTNSTGWITGSTKTGTGVSVSASELVSGTYSVTSSGTKDVTNYASVSVPSGTEGTPTATKGTVSNHSISVTPSVTNSGGYISGTTKTGTAVSVSASELVSGSETKTANGTYDVTNLASLVVAIPFSTITTSSSNPTGGNNGDVWIKTS